MITKDKILHFVAGLGVALLVGVWAKSPMAGFAAAIVAGVAKEALDYYRNKKEPGSATVDRMDAAWTFGGGFIGLLMLVVASYYGTL